MNLQEFIAKYNGKHVDRDGKFGPQCVDLVRQYIAEVLEAPQLPFIGYAHEWVSDIGANEIEELGYKVAYDPEPGDIVVWGQTTDTPQGHTGIVVSTLGTGFESFDQNYPSGSKSHVEFHNYNKRSQFFFRYEKSERNEQAEKLAVALAELERQHEALKEEYEECMEFVDTRVGRILLNIREIEEQRWRQ